MLVYRLSSCPTTHTNFLRYEPTASYAVCCKFSRCSTGEGNQRAHRGSPQPGYNFDEGNTRLVRRSSVIVRVRRREPTLTAPFPSAAAEIRRRRYTFQTPPPSTMARQPALHAPLLSATSCAVMSLLRRLVALQRERVHPLLYLTMWWRSVWGVGRPTLKTFFPAMRWRSV